MDLACPKEHATEIWNDSDHSTKVAPTILLFLPSKCTNTFSLMLVFCQAGEPELEDQILCVSPTTQRDDAPERPWETFHADIWPLSCATYVRSESRRVGVTPGAPWRGRGGRSLYPSLTKYHCFSHSSSLKSGADGGSTSPRRLLRGAPSCHQGLRPSAADVLRRPAPGGSSST